MRLLHRLPMTWRLSLAVAAAVLATAAGTMQIAVQSLSRQVERQIDRVGQIYLDGLAAALLPSVLAQDPDGIERALDEALRMHQGVIDRRLLLLERQGHVLARADRAGLDEAEPPAQLQVQAAGHALEAADGSYWVWRPLADQRLASASRLTVVANLDVSDYVHERRLLWWRLAAFNLGIGVVFALLALALMRRLQRPRDLLTRHLQQAGTGTGPMPVAAADIPAHDPETTRLLLAYNRMAQATREREQLLGRMAEQEREAVLGRLAATLAHEVRNPLAGVLTAVDTLRKFGDRPQARAEALDFMERGMRALAAVADATLATYRPAERAQTFGPDDLQDIDRLVAPQARRAGVQVRLESSLQAVVPVAGGEVRQVLLNLLLNALQASAPGSTVTLRCALADASTLRLEVIDEGCGLPSEMARSLEQSDEPGGSGLGVAVIVRLVQRLRGRVAVDAHSDRGTHIVLDLPLAPAAGTLDIP